MIEILLPSYRQDGKRRLAKGEERPLNDILEFASHSRQVEAGGQRSFTAPPSPLPRRPKAPPRKWGDVENYSL